MALVDINGNPINSGGVNAFFNAIPGFSGGLQLPSIPTAYTPSDGWAIASSGTEFFAVLGNVGAVYTGRMFTGTVYLRHLKTSPYTYNSMGIKLVQSSDFLTNPTGEASGLEPEYTTFTFDVDGETSKTVGVLADGSYGLGKSADVTDATGYVSLSKYVIPAGYYGVLVSKPVTSSTTVRWVDRWVTMFTIDSTDNITNLDVEAYPDILLPLEQYQEPFLYWMANDARFRAYFAQYADTFLRRDVYAHTKGKSLYIGGDSLHQYAGGTICKYNQYLGFKTLANAGYAGSTWSGTGTGGGLQRVTELVEAGVPYDVFILAWGTNDDAGGDGTIDDEASNAEGATMVSAMKWCITQLRTTFRYSSIGIIIPPPKGTNEGMKEKGDLMVEVCKLLHVPYVDMREYLSMDDMSSDGVHLGYGANRYGAAEAKLILDICAYGDPITVSS